MEAIMLPEVPDDDDNSTGWKNNISFSLLCATVVANIVYFCKVTVY